MESSKEMLRGSLKDTSFRGVSIFVDSYRHVTVRLSVQESLKDSHADELELQSTELCSCVMKYLNLHVIR